jgi:hypothetical protein
MIHAAARKRAGVKLRRAFTQRGIMGFSVCREKIRDGFSAPMPFTSGKIQISAVDRTGKIAQPPTRTRRRSAGYFARERGKK